MFNAGVTLILAHHIHGNVGFVKELYQSFRLAQ